MHDDILKPSSGKLGEECDVVACHFGHLDGEFVSVTIEVTVEPVAGIKDVASGLGCVCQVICQLNAEAGTVRNTVPTLGYIDVFWGLDEVVAVCQVTLESIDFEAAALLADTELVELVCCCYCIAWSVAKGQHGFALAVTIGRTGSIDLTRTKCCGNGEGICTNLLNPGNVALVGVQLETDATVGKLVIRHDGHALGVAPSIGGIVVRAGTTGTTAIDVCEVGLQVDGLQVAIVTSDGAAAAVGEIEVAAIIDDKTVDDVGTSVAPTNNTAAVLGSCTIDGELCQTVLNHRTLVSHANDTAVTCITCHRADHIDINVAAHDGTAAPCCDTAGILLL